MDGSTVAIIAIAGLGLSIGCATAYVWMTAPVEDRPDEYMLGYEAYLRDTVRPDRLPPSLIPSADSELGGPVHIPVGGPPFFIFDDAFVFRNEGPAAPVSSRHRGRFRLVK